jgi:5'-nucleotidase
MRFAIDMDDVIADATQQFIDFTFLEFGIRLTKPDIVDKSMKEVLPDHHERAAEFVHRLGFFRTLKVIEDSQDVLRELNDKHEILIVSAATEFPNSMGEKMYWLAEHFPFITHKQVIFCGDKSHIKADIMIDDHVKNLVSFQGKPYLFSAPHNRGVTQFERLNTWKEVHAKFL